MSYENIGNGIPMRKFVLLILIRIKIRKEQEMQRTEYRGGNTQNCWNKDYPYVGY